MCRWSRKQLCKKISFTQSESYCFFPKHSRYMIYCRFSPYADYACVALKNINFVKVQLGGIDCVQKVNDNPPFFTFVLREAQCLINGFMLIPVGRGDNQPDQVPGRYPGAVWLCPVLEPRAPDAWAMRTYRRLPWLHPQVRLPRGRHHIPDHRQAQPGQPARRRWRSDLFCFYKPKLYAYLLDAFNSQ